MTKARIFVRVSGATEGVLSLSVVKQFERGGQCKRCSLSPLMSRGMPSGRLVFAAGSIVGEAQEFGTPVLLVQ